MLEYNRIDISERIDVNETNASNKCDICHYWYFKHIGFKYEPYLCNGCYDLMQKAMSFNDAALFYVKGSAYRIHFWYMSKDDAISIMNSSNLIDKKGVLYFFIIYKNEWNKLLSKKQRVTINRAKDYYENDKERLRQQARYKYRNLSEEEKKQKETIWKKQISQYVWRKKQRLKEYQKSYRETRKSQYNN